LVVAEGRPFCAALLWVDRRDFAESRAALDAAILRLNRELPHPEQVKRWTALPGSPTVATGELTPNLKLRRAVVLGRFAREVDALYAGRAGESGVDVHEAPREEALT
jgi:long-chain acyl-CoA synthetase